MKSHRYRRAFGLPLAALLTIALLPLAARAEVLPRRPRTEPDRKDAVPAPEKGSSPRPVPSPFLGEDKLLKPEENGPAGSFDDALETPIDPDTYRLGPGDQLYIGITARTPAAYTAIVSPDGTIFLPIAGDVSVGGLTLNQARGAITRRLDRIRRPGTFTASIRLTRLRRIKIQVLGEVEQPGMYLVGPLTRVVEAISRAGGITPIASRRHVRLTRAASGSRLPEKELVGAPLVGALVGEPTAGRAPTRGAPTLLSSVPPENPTASRVPARAERGEGAEATSEIDLEKIVLQGDPAGNVLLETGDVLFVPRARQMVTVSGEVNHPGDYECDPGDTVATLLERAGGARSQGALSAVQVERPDGGDRRGLLAADLTANGGAMLLQDRDRIVVPKLSALQGRLRVIGAVKGGGENWQPDMDATVPRTADIVNGIYLLRRGDRVRDVLENLGGATAKADVTKAKIDRPDGNGGRKVIPVNLYRAVVLQDPTQNVELQDGDTLLIPKIQDKVYVLGEVARQGEQEYVEGKSVLDYVSMAGGPGPRAKRSETVIVRGSGPDGQLIHVRLDQLMAGKEPTHPVAVRPGDIIVLPAASIRGWQEVAQVLYTLRSLTTGLFLFH
jgi:polysaccharide biosynthesis/export protein